MENPIKTVIDKAKSTPKEAYTKLGVKQCTFSRRMNTEVQGSIEWSIEVAKELNVNKYTIVRDGYVVSVKLNNKK